MTLAGTFGERMVELEHRIKNASDVITHFRSAYQKWPSKGKATCSFISAQQTDFATLTHIGMYYRGDQSLGWNHNKHIKGTGCHRYFDARKSVVNAAQFAATLR